MTDFALRDPDVRSGVIRPVAGVRQPSSLGVARYCDRLAQTLGQLGADYQLADGPLPDRGTHFHLANSSRRAILQAPRTGRFVVTLHDVRPRAEALLPLYRALVYPRVVERAAAVIVHSHFAADLLCKLRVAPRRLEVIPHPAAPPSCPDRAFARMHLGLEEERLVAVLPGVIKSAKLVHEAIAAAGAVRDEWLLILAGPIRDRHAAREARDAGALVIESPDDVRYEQLIVAADAVLCLRVASIGETNGPLLDALGAGRAVLATSTGSIPETAADAALYVRGSAASVAEGLRALADPSERRQRERAAEARSAGLSWTASAQAHLRLFAEVFD
jgi:glycosyltransferase involved in cell wall biosynthesis